MRAACRLEAGPVMRRRRGTWWPRTVAAPSQRPSTEGAAEARAKVERVSRKRPANSFPARTFMGRLDSLIVEKGDAEGREYASAPAGLGAATAATEGEGPIHLTIKR